MMNMKKAMRGFLLLLCLGFFAFANNAWAKSDADKFNEVLEDYAKFKEKTGLTCAAVENANLNFELKASKLSEYLAQQQDIQAQIGNLCNKYSGSSKDYNACTSGGNVSTDNLDQAAANARKAKIKELKQQESSVKATISKYENYLSERLAEAKNGLKACEADNKDSNKADKKAEKADKKADKAQNKADDAKKDYDEANQNYETCMANAYGANYKADGNDNDPSNKCSKEYKKLAKAAEKYQKKQDKADDKKDKADAKHQAADDAEQEKLNGQCKSPLVWNKNIDGCAPSSTWSKAQYEDIYKPRYKACVSKLTSTGKDPVSGEDVYKADDLNKCRNEGAKETNAFANFAISCAQEGSDDNECEFVGDYLAKNPTASLADARKEYLREFLQDCTPMPDGSYADPKCQEASNELNGGLNADGTSLGGGEEYNTKESCEGAGGTWEGDKCTNVPDQQNDKAEALGELVCPKLSEIGTKSVTIFDYLACRITNLLIRIRMIVYVLAGFGMIAFAYGAIIGKISFKQLANIGIGLFILSMVTSIIEYTTEAERGGADLKYGNYLKDGHSPESVQAERAAIQSRAASGSSGSGSRSKAVQENCDNDASLCPDVSLLNDKNNIDKSWSFGDVVNSIKNVTDAVSTGISTFNTVANAVSTAKNAVENIADAISGTNDHVRTAEANLDTARENLAYAQQGAAAAREAQAAAQDAYDSALATVDSYNAMIAEEKAEIDALSKALKSGDLSAASPETLSEIAEAESKLAEDKARLALLEDIQNLDKLKKSAEAADQKVADLEAQLAELDPVAHPSQKAAYDALQKKLAEAKAAADDLHGRVDAAEAEASNPDLDLQGEMASLKTAIADDEYRLNEATTKAKTEIQDQIAEMKDQLAGHQADLKDAKDAANAAKKDLNSANGALKKAENGVKTAENVVSNCERNLENAKEGASKNFFETMSTIASNASTLANTVNNTANTVARNSSSMANNIQNAGRNGATQDYYNRVNAETEKLEKKCASKKGCSDNEKAALARMQEERDSHTNAVDKALNSNTGQAILNGTSNAAAIASSGKKTANAAKSGNRKGNAAGDKVAGKGSGLGDALGIIGGIASGTSTGVKENDKNSRNGNYDFRSNNKKQNDAANQK